MFWNRFYELCQRQNVSPNAVAKELGISSGAVTEWKKGRVPRHTLLEKIADYFNVSVDYLLGKQDSPLVHTVVSDDNTTQSVELTPQEADLLEKLKQLDDDQAKQMLDYLEFLIQQRKKKE